MGEQKRDIVERLQQLATWGDEQADLNSTHTVEVIRAAIAEIEHLRSVAGAVSQGESFNDIKGQLKAGGTCSIHGVPMVSSRTSGGQMASYCPQCAAHGGLYSG